MGRRPYSDKGKEIRRVRIALREDDWAKIDAECRRQWWNVQLYEVVQRILHEWANSDRSQPDSQLTTGPVVSSVSDC